MNTYSKHLKRKVINLNGIWDFSFLGEGQSTENIDLKQIGYNDKMSVPSAWDAFPSYAGKRGVAVYRTFATIPAGSKSFLKFHGTGMWNRVMVDGKKVGEFALPYSEVNIEVPPSENDKREIVVVNDNRFNFDKIALQENFYDFYAYGGLFRSVELHVVPEISIKRVKIDSPSAETGDVSVEIFFTGVENGGAELSIAIDDQFLKSEKVTIANGSAKIRFSFKNAKEWSAESPQLYTLCLEIPGDDFRERFGFRQMETKNGGVFLNGKYVKLLGYCRHEAHPQLGPAIPLTQHIQDLQILKSLGCNFIRGSHYPQDSAFLDLCDELGFYVFEESMGWGNREKHFKSEPFCRDQKTQTELMIDKSYNHPSVIMWGFLNEGASNEEWAVSLYRDLYDLCKQKDRTRPVTYASMFPFDDKCYQYADIISINQYPGWYASDVEMVRPYEEINPLIDKVIEHLKTSGQADKPFIISEMGAGAIYGWHDPLNAHWTEEYQADYLAEVCQRVVDDAKIAGVSLWQYCDCRTYASSRALVRPRAFNNKGTFDEYRRPKMAAKVVKEIFRSI